MKVHVFVMGFDRPERIHSTIERFFLETDIEGLDLTFTLIEARYPFPDAAGNMLVNASYVIGATYSDAFPVPIGLVILDRNYGQDGNYNYLSKNFEYADDDVIVFYDTDHRPDKRSWLKDKAKLLELPITGFVTMNCSCTDNALKNQGHEELINGVRCRVICWPGGWPTGAWKGKFFRNGIKQSHGYYGGSEGNILNALRANGFVGYMMSDHDDLRDLVGMDSMYQAWKVSVIATPGKQQSFEEYLKGQGLLR